VKTRGQNKTTCWLSMAFLYLLYESNPRSSISYKFYQKFRLSVDTGRCRALAPILKLAPKTIAISGLGGSLFSPGAGTTASPSETSTRGSRGSGRLWNGTRNKPPTSSVGPCRGREGERPAGLCAKPLPPARKRTGK